MQSAVTLSILCLVISFSAPPSQKPGGARQLFAVRGEVTRIRPQGKGALLVTVRPAKEFAEVTVLAGENARVGSAAGRAGDLDLVGLLGEDAADEEAITAAELVEGDQVSVIYDPQSHNRALEIYLR
jgi:hypothetical protein